MPSAKPTSSGVKRKHSAEVGRQAQSSKQVKKLKKTGDAKHATTKPAKAVVKTSAISQEEILELEEAIVESPTNYNEIVTLLGYVKDLSQEPEIAITAAVSLCRTFCRLMAKGKLSKRKGDSEDEVTVVLWLKERYKEYFAELCTSLDNEDPAVQNTALTLLMRLVKEEATHLKPPGEECFFPYDSFGKVIKALYLAENVDEPSKMEFVEKYVNEYDDIRYSFFMAIGNLAEEQQAQNPDKLVSAILNTVLSIENLPTAETDDIEDFYAITPPKSSKGKLPPIMQLSQHRKVVQDGWLSILKLPLTDEQCKQVLLAMTQRIVPSFTKPHLLMDFLTDSYNFGGSMSLLALNGLFQLISSKNLDYPNFYPKLYALLNRDLFHVRYRSRFFRLLDVFLGSTHLPAALIASFIKKMARLSLNAPPGAIVIVVPFMYNLFKKHRACTYMMHRVPSAGDLDEWRKNGYPDDPFDENEEDPLQTGAIDSCIWEIEMLMTHWHPNVATLCRIIKEQFTKEQYNLEDFLDHTYGSMFDAEANKNVKKPPVVEYDIPKRIFSRPEGIIQEEGENPLLDLWNFE
ncbi:CBF/Mak21 family-domain-containing protein [Geopyxis carbonaria]|nr:CBF/Mak21 family-domain-containing protein [Geopyxis carbonaria]